MPRCIATFGISMSSAYGSASSRSRRNWTSPQHSAGTPNRKPRSVSATDSGGDVRVARTRSHKQSFGGRDAYHTMYDKSIHRALMHISRWQSRARLAHDKVIGLDL